MRFIFAAAITVLGLIAFSGAASAVPIDDMSKFDKIFEQADWASGARKKP